MPGKSSNQKLREACRSRANTSIESLRALLEENPKPNINFEFSNGDLPLRCALEAGKEDWAVELLQHGAEIPKNDGVPDQALLRLAADRGFAKAVALLLEKGAAVDYPGKRLAKCQTPLHAAALKGHTKVMEVLLKNGANPNLSHDRIIDHPLYFAVRNQDIKSVQLLLDHMESPITEALSEECLTKLLEYAVSKKQEAIVCLLKGRGATVHGSTGNLHRDFEAQMRHAATADLAPLLWAAENSDSRMVQALLTEDMSSDLEIKDNRGNTPLSLAVQAGAVDIVHLLIEKGASLKVSNEKGLPPLSLAAGLDCPAIVQLLLDRGANIEEKTSKGQTALIRAVAMGIPENVRLLLSAGASPRTEDTSKTTLVAVAKSGFERYEAVLALLQSHSDRNKHASPTNYTDLPSSEKIFDRLVVAVAGTFRGRTHANLEKFIIHHGGTFSRTVRANCTHLVTTPREAEKNGTKIQQALIQGCKIVTIDWLLSSEEAKSLVSEESYRLLPSTGVHKKIIVKDDLDSNKDNTRKKFKNGFDRHQPTAAKPDVNVQEGYHPWANIRQVYIDESGVTWDATLKQTGAAQNCNKFYRIQLLVSADGTEYQTRTRWGRVGTKGRSVHLGDGSFDSAQRIFEKKFEDKSGLAWKDRAEDPIANKYTFIENDV